MKRYMNDKITCTSRSVRHFMSRVGGNLGVCSGESRSLLRGKSEFAPGKVLAHYLLLTLLLLMVGVTGAWGEDLTNGYYYICNMNKENGGQTYNPATGVNWYLCPTEGNFDNIYFQGDPKMPFLTTYQTGRVPKSKWIIQKTDDNDYYIIHAQDGKYLTTNEDVEGGNNKHRKRVHLEQLETPTDINKFTIVQEYSTTAVDNVYNIRHKTLVQGDHKYLNPSGNNQKNYGPETGYSGLIGLWSAADDNGSKWYFEFINQCVTPEISVKLDGEVSITSVTSGAAIYYTTDGSEPSASSSTYTGSFTISNTTTVKAIAIKADYTDSDVAEVSLEKTATPVIETNCDNTVTITCATNGSSVYYTTNGDAPTLTNSVVYTQPFIPDEGANIKAIAYVDNGQSILSDAAEPLTYTRLFSTAPVIQATGTNVVITGTGVIYYTTNGDDPTVSGEGHASPVSFTLLEGNPKTVIKAISKDGSLQGSCIVEEVVLVPVGIDDIDGLKDMASHPDYAYRLTADINDASSFNEDITFSGVFDGGYHKIEGLSQALFNSVNGGTVKNVILNSVNITNGDSDGDAGAICNKATGAAKIYNCGVLSGSVSGSRNVGGLVGLIQSGSRVRVINCYNYATVSGGSTMAGIVGNNEGTVGDVRIAMCMMYGNMSGTSPVYAGNHTPNVQNFTEYNYYRSKANLTYTTYNDQLAIDKDDYLTRFPFYRHILNTHRELASYFLFGDYSEGHVAEIGHWVLNKEVARFPIVEKWETNTKRIMNAPAGPLVDDEKLGPSLAITVKIGDNEYTGYSLPITDMDEANYDYTYGKVVLPFANEFEVNTDYSKICTGWKITNIEGGNDAAFENHNYANRDCTAKDLYDNSKFIFAQGGYFIVPYNVTAITIEANFADAFYLSDATYDVGYKSNYTVPTGLGGEVPTTFHGQTVYFNIVDALAKMEDRSTPHDQAVVLVGNYHFPTEIPSDKDANPLSGYTSKAFTLMSIDEDNNQEPDYGWYSNNSLDRPAIAPVRFDFIPLISLGMSSHVSGSTGYPGIPIWKPRGWFETTETSLCIMNQFELDSGNFANSAGNIYNRSIINGGYFVQMVRANSTSCNKVNYIQVGGNAYIKEFYPGNHSKQSREVPLVPINVTGGEIEQCFMTGYGKGTATGSDIRFWCAGGKIHKFLGAYMENPKTAGVNVTAKIDHALIGRFYGGGTSANATVKGNIDVTINNSKVDFYCGGPEFGDMTSGKTVTTRATNTVFGEYYGAGFGGTSISYSNDEDKEINIGNGATTDYPDYFTTHYKGAEEGRLKQKNGGIGTCYKFEYIVHSYKQATVARFYTGYAQFSLATTGSVTNILNKCKFRKLAASETVLGEESTSGDFYGAGCQGKVDGTVESTLTGCTVEGSAYGGGYKAESNELDVYPETKPELSKYYRETGLFSDFGEVTPDTYTWTQGDSENKNTVKEGETSIYTDVVMSDLGNVTGAITLTIHDGSVAHDVYGGGNESKSLDNTSVTLEGNANIGGNVFGGGNKAEVLGNTTVNIPAATSGTSDSGSGSEPENP